MAKSRIPETNVGIQGTLNVEVFNQFARGMRDKGMLPIQSFIQAGIQKGKVLEIGPGPDYVGLEWLKLAPEAELIGLEISPNMIQIAEKNVKDYGFENRVKYITGNTMTMPFPDNSFDGVFSEGSLHEWESPVNVFNEIYRVLKPGGKFCITDLHREIHPIIKFFISHTVKPKEIRPGFITSVNAAYTVDEINEILRKTRLKFTITKNFMGLTIAGERNEIR
jgi:ubiquinone/menaquinone biosynthesis C-methylase UbiE